MALVHSRASYSEQTSTDIDSKKFSDLWQNSLLSQRGRDSVSRVEDYAIIYCLAECYGTHGCTESFCCMAKFCGLNIGKAMQWTFLK